MLNPVDSYLASWIRSGGKRAPNKLGKTCLWVLPVVAIWPPLWMGSTNVRHASLPQQLFHIPDIGDVLGLLQITLLPQTSCRSFSGAASGDSDPAIVVLSPRLAFKTWVDDFIRNL